LHQHAPLESVPTGAPFDIYILSGRLRLSS
jgi:hypothetical protein